MMNDHKFQVAALLLRVFAGVLFLFQGYDKLFRVKVSGVVNAFTSDAEHYHIPRQVLSLVSYYTSIVEFFGGFFLLAGFFTTYTLYLLGIDLVLVGIAFSFMTPMWDMKHVFPRLVLVAALLLLPEQFDTFSIDHYILTR